MHNHVFILRGLTCVAQWGAIKNRGGAERDDGFSKGLNAWNLGNFSKQTGMDPIERLCFLAPGTSAREGGEKTQPFNRFPSHRVNWNLEVTNDRRAICPLYQDRFGKRSKEVIGILNRVVCYIVTRRGRNWANVVHASVIKKMPLRPWLLVMVKLPLLRTRIQTSWTLYVTTPPRSYRKLALRVDRRMRGESTSQGPS